jgi:hypothetical protein
MSSLGEIERQDGERIILMKPYEQPSLETVGSASVLVQMKAPPAGDGGGSNLVFTSLDTRMEAES